MNEFIFRLVSISFLMESWPEWIAPGSCLRRLLSCTVVVTALDMDEYVLSISPSWSCDVTKFQNLIWKWWFQLDIYQNIFVWWLWIWTNLHVSVPFDNIESPQSWEVAIKWKHSAIYLTIVDTRHMCKMELLSLFEFKMHTYQHWN